MIKFKKHLNIFIHKLYKTNLNKIYKIKSKCLIIKCWFILIVLIINKIKKQNKYNIQNIIKQIQKKNQTKKDKKYSKNLIVKNKNFMILDN